MQYFLRENTVFTPFIYEAFNANLELDPRVERVEKAEKRIKKGKGLIPDQERRGK
jgi:hypothetical protein